MKTSLCTLLLFLISTQSYTEVIVNVAADSFVQSHTPDDNFGSEANLRIKRGPDDIEFNRKAYFRFDTSDIDFATSDATLNLNFIDTGLGTTPPDQVWEFEVYGLNDGVLGEIFDENSITWNNAPGNDINSGFLFNDDATSLGTFERTGEGIGSFDFSSDALTNFVNADTNNVITFMIARNSPELDVDTQYIHGIESREGGIGPQLTVQQAVPEPSTYLLLSILLIGIFIRQKKLKRNN